MYTNNQQLHNSKYVYPQKSYISIIFKGENSVRKVVVHCEFSHNGKFWTILRMHPFLKAFFKETGKCFVNSDSFILNGELWMNFSANCGMLYWNMQVKLQKIRTRAKFHMIGSNTNVSLGIAECSFCTLCIASILQKKIGHACIYGVSTILQTVAKLFIIPATQIHFIQGNVFNNAQVHCVVLVMNRNDIRG